MVRAGALPILGVYGCHLLSNDPANGECGIIALAYHFAHRTVNLLPAGTVSGRIYVSVCCSANRRVSYIAWPACCRGALVVLDVKVVCHGVAEFGCELLRPGRCDRVRREDRLAVLGRQCLREVVREPFVQVRLRDGKLCDTALAGEHENEFVVASQIPSRPMR